MNAKNILFLLPFLFLSACRNQVREDVTELLRTWNEKEILFPFDPVFTIQDRDTVNYPISKHYKILTYVNSIGCISCKLQLDVWKDFMAEVDTQAVNSVQYLFFFSPEKRKDLVHTLKLSQFTHPVCIDKNDSLNKLNHFPSNMTFQTFLLDKNNKVVAIGNPVHNPKVKELYLRILRGEQMTTEEEDKKIMATSIVALVAVVATYNVYQATRTNTMSELMLANVEALASGEAGSSDCIIYCTPDDRCTCIISYGGGIQGITCEDHRGK